MGDLRILDANYLGLCALVTVCLQLSFFFVAYTCQFDKVTDFAGTTNFLLLALLTLFLNDSYFARQIIVTSLVTAWALRLGAFLLYRVIRRENDARFDEMRSNFFAFLGFWIFQMFWVFVVSLPVIYLNAQDEDRSLRAQDYIGIALWATGFLLEAVADQSKLAWTENPSNRGKFINTGVWKWSRHPNYAGEILMWIAIFIICSTTFTLPSTPNIAWISILSPLYTFFILMFVSGVNLAEQRYNKKFAGRADYLEYRENTSPLIPLPNSLYSRLPRPAKYILCCEFSSYTQGLLDEDSDN